MKIYFIFYTIFLAFRSGQALRCYNCPLRTQYEACRSNFTAASCDTTVGFDRCSTFFTTITTSSGEEVSYLEKDCGIQFICDNPEGPNIICNGKNDTHASNGETLTNCTVSCCASNLCNTLHLDIQQPLPEPSSVHVVSFPSVGAGQNASAAVMINGSSDTTPPGTSQITTATPTPCGSATLDKFTLHASLLLATASFVLLKAFWA